jgi:hypothetical protein
MATIRRLLSGGRALLLSGGRALPLRIRRAFLHRIGPGPEKASPKRARQRAEYGDGDTTVLPDSSQSARSVD